MRMFSYKVSLITPGESIKWNTKEKMMENWTITKVKAVNHLSICFRNLQLKRENVKKWLGETVAFQLEDTRVNRCYNEQRQSDCQSNTRWLKHRALNSKYCQSSYHLGLFTLWGHTNLTYTKGPLCPLCLLWGTLSFPNLVLLPCSPTPTLPCSLGFSVQ